MRKKLSFCMLALTSCMVFGQSSKTIERQVSKYPSTTNSGKVKKSNATSSALASLSNGAKSAVQGKATVFQENFDGSGPGFEAWTVLDVDGKTPATAVNFITTGWNRIDKQGANGNFGGPAGDYAAMSTSWYTPAGTSNDWLITPSIAIPAGTSTFKWDAKAQDADYPDGYKLMLAPNGGNTVADFTVELYSTPGEDAAWVTRTVNTSAYAGTNVRLAFVNNSTDMFMLLVDNILVDAVAAPVTGCLTATNGQWPTATYTPNCNGANANITTSAYLNEYSKVNLVAGTAYTFSTSNSAYFITIGNEAGTAVLASGTGSVVYTPTASGVVRFYSHLSSNCDGGSTLHARIVKCGTPPPPPTACTDFKTPSNNRENGGFFGGETAQRLAIDIPVGSTGFTVHGMEPIVAGDATSFSFKFYSNNAGLPGAEIATRTGIIQSSVVTGTAFGYDFKKYTVAFDSPIDLDANTTYWVEVTSDAVAWESTSVNRLGSPDVFNNSGTSGAWVAGTTDYVFNLVCSPLLAVGDASNAKFSYYPNPVVDYLNISSSTKVESVSVYNIAGQKMPVSAKLVNGKVDMSKLAPGVYIITTTLDGGKNESFKVVKK